MRNPFALCLALLTVLPAVSQESTAAEYPARLASAPPLQLSTPLSGVVSRVLVRPGQIVEQGALLLELDQRLIQARLKRARAELEKTRQDRDEALRELERTQEMYDRTLISQHDLQVTEITAASAEAAHQSAEAALEEAVLNREYSRLLAPFGARVESVSVQSGQTLVHRCQARALVTLIPEAYWLARADMQGADAGRPRPGGAASVTVGDAVFPAEIDAVSSLPGTESGAPVAGYRLVVRFSPPAGASLRAGQAASIRLDE